MATSRDETRREFLLTLARGAAFVPPLMATVAVRPVAGQGGGGGKATSASSSSTVGSLSPTAQTVASPAFQLQDMNAEAPWSPQTPAQEPPWSRPPPTQTGR